VLALAVPIASTRQCEPLRRYWPRLATDRATMLHATVRGLMAGRVGRAAGAAEHHVGERWQLGSYWVRNHDAVRQPVGTWSCTLARIGACGADVEPRGVGGGHRGEGWGGGGCRRAVTSRTHGAVTVDRVSVEAPKPTPNGPGPQAAATLMDSRIRSSTAATRKCRREQRSPKEGKRLAARLGARGGRRGLVRWPRCSCRCEPSLRSN
jgi:hypothetical protein